MESQRLMIVREENNVLIIDKMTLEDALEYATEHGLVFTSTF